MKFEGGKRIDRIKLCKECMGNPQAVPFSLGAIKGTRCAKVTSTGEECYEVIEYEKVKEVKPKKKKE